MATRAETAAARAVNAAARAAARAAEPLSAYERDVLKERARRAKKAARVARELKAANDEPSEQEILIKANAEYLRRLALEKLQALRDERAAG
jgi:hypothetical protein